jgi:pectate lyase
MFKTGLLGTWHRKHYDTIEVGVQFEQKVWPQLSTIGLSDLEKANLQDGQFILGNPSNYVWLGYNYYSLN